MDHDQHLVALREETDRLLTVLTGVAPDTPVPTCAWTAAELLWHVAEVQSFWARVVGEKLHGEQISDPPRPADDELDDFAARAGTALLGALAARRPEEECWSWHDDGRSVGWVSRRQAHEALIHRVDAELTAGVAVQPPSVALAADGVDEVLRVMVHGVPDWATFTPDGARVEIRCTDDASAWTVRLGRFTGTSPRSGRTYDDVAAMVADEEPPPGAPEPGLVVAGTAWDLDRWLWGRGDAAGLDLTGDEDLLGRLRAVLAAATQ